MAAPKMKIRIGDLLVQNGVISEAQLMEALDRQKQTRQKLGKTLVTMGYVQEQQFLEFLSQQLNIPLVELGHYSFNQEDVLSLPETQARRFRALVLKEEPIIFWWVCPTRWISSRLMSCSACSPNRLNWL